MIKAFYNLRIAAMAVLFCAFSLSALASAGDTLKVRTIEFSNSDKRGSYIFPDKSEKFERILMNYTIKCPCGEWDYLEYIYADTTEIARFITPYGNGLDLGSGFRWVVDVTDFEPFLHGEVYIKDSADPWTSRPQTIEVTFDFIKGTPPRDIIRVEKLWQIAAEYNKDFEQNLPAKTIDFTNDEKTTNLKFIHTGHGFNNGTDCSEFCEKYSYVKVNNETKYSQKIWRDNCNLNPVYPQGGTWFLSRTNWCPGSMVSFYDYDLTPFVTPGTSASIDYDMQYFDTPTSGFKPRWDITGYLITYTAPNFKNDATIIDILSPTDKNEYSRFNPVCNTARVMLRNNGSDTLKSIHLKYGIAGIDTLNYNWNGRLSFFETFEIPLDLSQDIDYVDSVKYTFFVEVSNPNGKEDENPSNNISKSYFYPVPEFDEGLIMVLKTNKNAAYQYTWDLSNYSGDILYSGNNLDDLTTYRDTFQLQKGCYDFMLRNNWGIGLSNPFYDSAYSSGNLRFFNKSKLAKIFNPDFGANTYLQFRIDQQPQCKFSQDTVLLGNVYDEQTPEFSVEVSPLNKRGISIKSIDMTNAIQKGITLESTEPVIPTEGLKLSEGQKLILHLKLAPKSVGPISSTIQVLTNDYYYSSKTLRIKGIIKSSDGIAQNPLKENSDISLELNPNISLDNQTVEFKLYTDSQRKIDIAIYNTIGQKVSSIITNEEIWGEKSGSINTSLLNDGIYYVVASSNSGHVTKALIIKK